NHGIFIVTGEFNMEGADDKGLFNNQNTLVIFDKSPVVKTSASSSIDPLKYCDPFASNSDCAYINRGDFAKHWYYPHYGKITFSANDTTSKYSCFDIDFVSDKYSAGVFEAITFSNISRGITPHDFRLWDFGADTLETNVNPDGSMTVRYKKPGIKKIGLTIFTSGAKYQKVIDFKVCANPIYKTKSEKGIWLNSNTWKDELTPGLNINKADISVNGHITSYNCMQIDKGTLYVHDTLLINGDLFLGNYADIVVDTHGVLVVYGNYSSGNKTEVTNYGEFVVTGKFEMRGKAGQGYFNNLGSLVIFDPSPTIKHNYGADDHLKVSCDPSYMDSDCAYKTRYTFPTEPFFAKYLSIPFSVRDTTGIYKCNNADFILDKKVVAMYEEVGLINITRGLTPTSIIKWTFDTDTISTKINPGGMVSVAYKSPGIKNITLTVKNSTGTYTNTFSVEVLANAVFETNDTSGIWLNDTIWKGNQSPGLEILGNDVYIDGHITVNNCVNINKGTLFINDTLIINGGLHLGNYGNLEIAPKGVLIVFGDYTSGNNSEVNSSGYFIVTGQFEMLGSGRCGYFKNAGKVYIFDELPIIKEGKNYADLWCDYSIDPPDCNYGSRKSITNNAIYTKYKSYKFELRDTTKAYECVKADFIVDNNVVNTFSPLLITNLSRGFKPTTSFNWDFGTDIDSISYTINGNIMVWYNKEGIKTLQLSFNEFGTEVSCTLQVEVLAAKTFETKEGITSSWFDESAWEGDVTPGDYIKGANLEINGSITSNHCMELDKGALHVYDTLLINGNLKLGSKGKIIVHETAVMIVYGDFTAGTRSEITNHGHMIFVGDFSLKDAGNNGFFKNDSTVVILDDLPKIPKGRNYTDLTCGSSVLVQKCGYLNKQEFVKNEYYATYRNYAPSQRTEFLSNSCVKADYLIDFDSICSGASVQIINTSRGIKPLGKIEWDFDGGVKSTGSFNNNSFYVKYNSPGRKSIKLSIEDGGVSSSYGSNIHVVEKPVTNLYDTVLCGTQPSVIRATSTNEDFVQFWLGGDTPYQEDRDAPYIFSEKQLLEPGIELRVWARGIKVIDENRRCTGAWSDAGRISRIGAPTVNIEDGSSFCGNGEALFTAETQTGQVLEFSIDKDSIYKRANSKTLQLEYPLKESESITVYARSLDTIRQCKSDWQASELVSAMKIPEYNTLFDTSIFTFDSTIIEIRSSNVEIHYSFDGGSTVESKDISSPYRRFIKLNGMQSKSLWIQVIDKGNQCVSPWKKVTTLYPYDLPSISYLGDDKRLWIPLK
ncbi:MAG: PKD domain-containing protein, partial [Bacteroidales bacterium]|nr:PKD domain-containing protein [Bacteroidales bacterium]